MKHIPKDLEEGILYVSLEYETAQHLCPCGCKGRVVTPLGKGGWEYKENVHGVTLRPSIGNWNGEKPNYHAHYFITDSHIIWC